MNFEWDEEKRSANLTHHRVDFADAVGVLLDQENLTQEDPDSEGERRFLTLGRSYKGAVLLVVWTERSGDTVRIISARRASPAEARHYREN